MKIYFAVTDQMIQNYSMPETFSASGHYRWSLTQEKYLGVIGTSEGEILQSHSEIKSFIICEGYLSSDALVAEALTSALMGSKMAEIPVTVRKMVQVNRL